MLTEDDFNDDDSDKQSEYPPDPIHVQFFLNYVKLTEIMGLVLSQQYSVACKSRKHNALDLTHSDMALADWLQNCPKEVYWERGRHHFWSALLHANYYTTLCLLHRAHMPPAGTPNTAVQDGLLVETAYPSRNIAYQAAGMITSIIEGLQSHDELRFTPAFIVYSLFSALIMHIYQMRSSNSAIVTATEQRMRTCMTGLKEVSKVWLVAKMVHTLFDSILGNKTLEERLQKAAGRKHVRARGGAEHRPAQQNQNHFQQSSQQTTQQKQQQPPRTPGALDSATKRKFDDTELGYPNGQPTAQMSYERSRPQTPSITPSTETPHQQHHQNIPTMAPPMQGSSPQIPRNDAFMGTSRDSTRQTTPFASADPPDLFLVTRNSPSIPQDIWSNFQPDQLFPADTNLSLPNTSPSSTQTNFNIDPQLAHPPQPMHSNTRSSLHAMSSQAPPQAQSGQHPAFATMPPQSMAPQADVCVQPQQPPGHEHMTDGVAPPHHQTNSQAWAQYGAINQQGQQPMDHRNEESWNGGSLNQGGLTIPTSMNVEDW